MHRIEQHGSGVSRENWMPRGHLVTPRGIAAEGSFCIDKRVNYLRKTIQRNLETDVYAKALTAMEQERMRNLRRSRVGLTIARTTLQTMREGCSYLHFEENLHSLHLTSVDIGSLNNSREFIKAFVESMTMVMDRSIERHLHSVDVVT